MQKEFFKCFGCGEGGDIFKFIELVQNCDFNEAVKRLAERAGIVPETNDWVGGSGGEDKRRDLFQAVTIASDIFQERLLDMSNKRVTVKNLGDHRICMASFVLAILTGAKTKIKNFETVNTSSPSFLKIMKSLGAKFEIYR